MSFADINIKSSGLFLKVEAGKPVTIRLLQDSPVSEMTHGFGKTKVACAGPGCPACGMEDPELRKPKQRFKINIYSHDSQKVMIFEFGPALCRQLKIAEKNLLIQGVKITDTDLIVDASGEKEQRKYQVTPMIKSKEIPSGLILHDLGNDLPL